MAYLRSGHGARALDNSITRRRALLKRILHERAGSVSSMGRTFAEALVVAPGATTNLQPSDTSPTSSNQPTNTPEESGDQHLPIAPQEQDSQLGAYGDSNSQLPLGQTQAASLVPQTLSASSPTELPILHNTLHTSYGQSSNIRQAFSSPLVFSLVIAPTSVNLLSLLSSQASTVGTSSSVSGVGSSTSLSDPVSTVSDNANIAPPISQNPPIIVGILFVVLLVMAASVALFSWLTRSARRRRKNRLDDLVPKTEHLNEALSKTNSQIFEEKGVEESRGELGRLCVGRIMDPSTSFYIGHHSSILNNVAYPAEDGLHDGSRTHNAPCLPALPQANVANTRGPYDNNWAANMFITESTFRSFPRSKEYPWTWNHDPNFLDSGEETRPDPKNGRPKVCGDDNAFQPQSKYPRPFVCPPDMVYQNKEKESSRPSSSRELSWATALRSNLVSAFDVVKHATDDRILQDAKSSEDSRLVFVEDKFTPLPLRPGRRSSGRVLPRRGTQEERNLAFRRVRLSMRSNATRSISRNNLEGGDEENLAELQHSDSHGIAHRAMTLRDLGRFSFEQGIGEDHHQNIDTGLWRERRNGMVIHSTALSRRRSGMASGSGSSSHSVNGASEMGTDVRMRRGVTACNKAADTS